MFEQVVIIAGVPRSGTSWLGQVFDSSPNTVFRYQPLFSYAFKNAINKHSTKHEIQNFFQDIYLSDDDYINQTDNRLKGLYPTFDKYDDPFFLVYKNVRYHYLIKKIIKLFSNVKVIGIIRNPCAVMNSWLSIKNDGAAIQKDLNPMKEWRYARSKNISSEEYYGFEKWKEAAYLFNDLTDKYPNQFRIIRYEKLVENTYENTKKLFKFVGMKLDKQTIEFLDLCHKKNKDHIYSVFKSKKVVDKWKENLDSRIKNKIFDDLKNTKLEIYLK